MRHVLFVAALSVAAINAYSAEDILRLYDGPTGVGCLRYNAGARINWVNFGGDFVDSSGVAQGSKAFSSVNLVINQTGPITFDVTKIGPEIMLRFNGSPVTLYSRESTALPPQLIVTNSDGSITKLKAIADAGIPYLITGADGKRKCASTGPTGTTATMAQTGAVIAFEPPPAGYRKLELQVTLMKAYGPSTVNAFKMVRPLLPKAEVTTGFATQYPKDKNICKDPRVLYCETWDRDDGTPPSDWWQRTKGTVILNSPSRWTRTSNGVAFPSAWTQVSYEPKGGMNGSGGLRVHYLANSLLGTAVPAIDFVKAGLGEQRHLYFRYYIKYDNNFFNSVPCDGGKRPGFAADNTYGGNGGARVFGYNGWSMRGHYVMNCDGANPMYPRVMFGTYAYHAQQAGAYGDDWPWSGRGDQGLQQLGAWACVEGEVFVNDPGVANGVDRHWLDGRLVFERTNVYMRGKKPAQGYGNWQVPYNATREAEWKAAGYPTLYDPLLKVTQYLVGGSAKTLKNSDLAITKFWGTAHHGGVKPFGKDVDQYYDQTVVATTRIGCMAP